MIPLFKPAYDIESTLELLREVLTSGWTGLGSKTAKFEERLCSAIGVKYCVALNSCTAALHLALRSLSLPRGSKVLTTPLTFVSTNHAILYEGLVPVFCDVEKTTGNMDLTMAAERIRRGDIGAIMLVHFAGYPCDMGGLIENRPPVIEDCAHAFGSRYDNKNIGSLGNLCCWSFHAVKNLSLGDGGAITTDGEGEYNFFKKMRWLGIDKSTIDRSKEGYSWEYAVEQLGFKYHMNDVSAAIGLANLPQVRQQNARRKSIADFYRANIRGAWFPEYAADRESSYHFFPVFFSDRDKAIARLKKADVAFGVHYRPTCDYPMYHNFELINNCANARQFFAHEITLPIGPSINDVDVEKVVEVLNG